MVNILLSPIFYHNTYERKNLSGYRADFKSYTKGSTKNMYNFYSSNNGVKLDFLFTYTTNFYEINLKKQVELLDFGGFILGTLAGLSFLSRIVKFTAEKLNIFNYNAEGYKEFVDEEIAKEVEDNAKKEMECKIKGYNYL